MFRKIAASLTAFFLFAADPAFCQTAARPVVVPDAFRPPHVRSLAYRGGDSFTLLVDKGDAGPVKEADAGRLMRYFLVGLALPDESFWVNLRPDKASEMIDPDLAKTDVGRILLEADLQLKKDVAACTSPQNDAGKRYWDKLYAKGEELFGSGHFTLPTVCRPWIVPDEIVTRSAAGSAYIYKATLKVMLEEDYLKTGAASGDIRVRRLNEYSAALLRELVIPRISREINSARRYAPLRQVYYSLALAQWFKKAAGEHRGLNVNNRNLPGLESSVRWSKETYRNAYLKSFEQGEYNLVMGSVGRGIRQYVSGGIVLDCGKALDGGMLPVTGIYGHRYESRFFYEAGRTWAASSPPHDGGSAIAPAVTGRGALMPAGFTVSGSVPDPSDASIVPESCYTLTSGGKVKTYELRDCLAVAIWDPVSRHAALAHVLAVNDVAGTLSAMITDLAATGNRKEDARITIIGGAYFEPGLLDEIRRQAEGAALISENVTADRTRAIVFDARDNSVRTIERPDERAYAWAAGYLDEQLKNPLFRDFWEGKTQPAVRIDPKRVPQAAAALADGGALEELAGPEWLGELKTKIERAHGPLAVLDTRHGTVNVESEDWPQTIHTDWQGKLGELEHIKNGQLVYATAVDTLVVPDPHGALRIKDGSGTEGVYSFAGYRNRIIIARKEEFFSPVLSTADDIDPVHEVREDGAQVLFLWQFDTRTLYQGRAYDNLVIMGLQAISAEFPRMGSVIYPQFVNYLCRTYSGKQAMIEAADPRAAALFNRYFAPQEQFNLDGIGWGPGQVKTFWGKIPGRDGGQAATEAALERCAGTKTFSLSLDPSNLRNQSQSFRKGGPIYSFLESLPLEISAPYLEEREDVLLFILAELFENAHDAIVAVADPQNDATVASGYRPEIRFTIRPVTVSGVKAVAFSVEDNGAGKLPPMRKGRWHYLGGENKAEKAIRGGYSLNGAPGIVPSIWAKETGIDYRAAQGYYRRQTYARGSRAVFAVPFSALTIKKPDGGDGGSVVLPEVGLPDAAAYNAYGENEEALARSIIGRPEVYDAIERVKKGGNTGFMMGIGRYKEFLADQGKKIQDVASVASLGPVVYNPMNSCDVLSPFCLTGASDLLAVSEKPFGDLAGDLHKMRNGSADHIASYSHFDPGVNLNHIIAHNGLTGSGSLAALRLVMYLEARIQGVYYFHIEADGSVRFDREPGGTRDNAVIRFQSASGEVKRFWYVRHDYATQDKNFSAFLQAVNFNTLLIKAAYDIFEFNESGVEFSRENAIKDMLAPAKRQKNAVAITDRRFRGRPGNQRYAMWQSEPLRITLGPDQYFGYSRPGEGIFFGPASALIDVWTPDYDIVGLNQELSTRGSFSGSYFDGGARAKGAGPGEKKTGGIDFRSLASAGGSSRALEAIRRGSADLNLAMEWQRLDRISSAGLTPSGERLREFTAACWVQGAIDAYRTAMEALVAAVLRDQETRAAPAEPALRDTLLLIEHG